ncbi:MAG: protoporphyrinogen/coproporphyrinogen oxidase [Candidatus Geothermincolia bacterium]
MGKTVVIGGGTSGLAAAYTLEEAGAECLVLEKRDFTGGRIYGIEKEGFTLDLGAQFFFSRYRTTFDLMRKLGIYDQMVKFAKPMGILRDGTVHIAYSSIRDNLRHPTSGIKFGALSSRGKRQGMKMGLKFLTLGKKLDFNDPLKAIELDNISFAEYARRHWGDEILEYAIQPIASTLTLAEPEDISAAYGLALAWYFVPGLSTTTKGIGYLAESLAKNVKNVRLNTEATRIVMDGNKVKGVEIKDGKKTEFIEADSVICGALAGETANMLSDLPPQILDTLGGIKYSACTHVMIATKGKVIGDMYAIATPRREGLCMAGFTDNANKAPTYAPPNTSLVHVFTFGKYAREMLDWDDAKIQDHVTQQIQSVVPQFPDEPIFCEIFRWPEAVCLSSPGQITAVQKLKVGMREFKGLHLAGEYFGMPSVEAALTSGVNAAGKVLRGL